MRVAIYARVSTDDKGQDPENQLRELRDWVINSGHVISREYVNYDSGRKGAEKRKQFAALFDDAAKRKFDCVLFWALDRFSREGMAQTIIHLQRLSSYGVAFHSYTEPHLATKNVAREPRQRMGDKPEPPALRCRRLCCESANDNYASRLDYQLRRGRAFAAAKSIMAIRRPNTM